MTSLMFLKDVKSVLIEASKFHWISMTNQLERILSRSVAENEET